MNRLDQQALDRLFLQARTANAFLDKPVPQALLREVYDLARMGPTSMNTQPARFVFLVTPQEKDRLLGALAPLNVEKTRRAPVTVIVAADSRFFEHLPQVWHRPGAQEMFAGNPALASDTALRNSSLGGAYFMMAARSVGLDCGPMSGFDPGQGQRRVLRRRPLPGQLHLQPGLRRLQSGAATAQSATALRTSLYGLVAS
jgi:3-hydroxypropanoate dehydrogenase